MSQPLIAEPVEVDVADLVTEDDTPVDNWFSEKQQRLLTEPLYSSWQPPSEESGQPRNFVAAANVGLFYSRSRPPLVPDMFLSLDAEIPENWYEKNHRSYFFWEFGKAPEVVVEIVSNREGGEATSKLRDYAKIAVGYYIIYDPTQQLSDETLRVYELTFRRYRQRADATLPELGLRLTLWEGIYEDKAGVWLRWCDAAGNLIPTGAERAAKAEQRAVSAEQRAALLAAKLRELGVDPDQLS
jgi:Uma2 family endonuclease